MAAATEPKRDRLGDPKLWPQVQLCAIVLGLFAAVGSYRGAGSFLISALAGTLVATNCLAIFRVSGWLRPDANPRVWFFWLGAPAMALDGRDTVVRLAIGLLFPWLLGLPYVCIRYRRAPSGEPPAAKPARPLFDEEIP